MEKPLPQPPRTEIDLDLLRWLQRIPDLLPRISVYNPVIDLASVNANTVSRQTFTVTGLDAADTVAASVSLTAGLHVISARASATDTLELTIWNSTGGALNQTSATFNVTTVR